MLALAATNVVGIVLFAAVYSTAGARLMPQAAFVVCLLVIFGLVTTLWVRVENRHRALDPIPRLGRISAALVLVVVTVPAFVLMPAFWLDSQLPAEADFTRYLAPIMTLVLISLALVVVVNVVGSIVATSRAVLARRESRRRP